MAIQFFGSPEPTIGVEIEIQLIDPETRDLTPRSIALLEGCRAQGIERVKAEITQAMIEVDTEISEDILNLMEHLAPVAKGLNSYEELLYVKEMIRTGVSAKRQRAVFHEKRSLQAVVDALIDDLETDTLTLTS
ncbi:MAG: hypothetical protein HYY45_10300 [Deltaproteobacteria bacterium]|nr:hypothetical protein [Deltaproteobacteria bacterium]